MSTSNTRRYDGLPAAEIDRELLDALFTSCGQVQELERALQVARNERAEALHAVDAAGISRTELVAELEPWLGRAVIYRILNINRNQKKK